MNDWKPHAKQIQFLRSTCFETLFGGARGGGKTDAGLAWLLYDVENPQLRELVIRRNFDDMKDWVDRSKTFYSRNDAKFIDSRREIEFPSGAKIAYGHLKDENSYTKYQGHEYQRILIEELTHIPTEKLYLQLIASCRSTVPGIAARVAATTNPGEIGHKWVKKRFVSVIEPGMIFTDPITGRTRLFVSAKVEDNPSLMNADPEYVKFLEGLPDGIREQWREGSWDDVEIKGAYFLKQMKQAQSEGRITSVPYEDVLPVHTFWDLGIDDEMAIWFWQFYGKEIRVIDCMSGSGSGMDEYFRKMRNMNYNGNWGNFYFPADVAVRELTNGKSRLDYVERIATDMGFSVKVGKKLPVDDRINATRLILGKCWFDRKCEEGIEALKSYHKEFDEKTRTYKEKPHHDWSSHYADAFGLGALEYQEEPERKIQEPQPHEIDILEKNMAIW